MGVMEEQKECGPMWVASGKEKCNWNKTSQESQLAILL